MIGVTASKLAWCQAMGHGIENMARGYDILRKLETGEVLPIASRNDLTEARNLAESLNSCWPAEYIVRDVASGAEIHLKNGSLAGGPQSFAKRDYLM
ncbi:MAG: hypothetical protein WA369_00890 [Candidatus Acidiferrales bacterium]